MHLIMFLLQEGTSLLDWYLMSTNNEAWTLTTVFRFTNQYKCDGLNHFGYYVNLCSLPLHLYSTGLSVKCNATSSKYRTKLFLTETASYDIWEQVLKLCQLLQFPNPTKQPLTPQNSNSSFIVRFLWNLKQNINEIKIYEYRSP